MSASSGGGSPPGSKTPDKSPDIAKSGARPGREQTDRLQRNTEARLTFASILHSRYGGGRDASIRLDTDRPTQLAAGHQSREEQAKARPMPQLQSPGPGGMVTGGLDGSGSRVKASAQARATPSAEATPARTAPNALQVTTATLEGETRKAIVALSVPPPQAQHIPTALHLHARAEARIAGVQRSWYDALKERREQQQGGKAKGVDVEIER